MKPLTKCNEADVPYIVQDIEENVHGKFIITCCNGSIVSLPWAMFFDKDLNKQFMNIEEFLDRNKDFWLR